MSHNTASPTRWFALSGREVLVLAAGVAAALLAVGATRLLGLIWPHGEIVVSEEPEVLPLPARLDVNAASDYELAMLPGIGPVTAAAIVAYRNANGPFTSLEELTRVSRISLRTVEAIRPYAMCRGPAPAPKARRN